jgi:hypothetical protein
VSRVEAFARAVADLAIFLEFSGDGTLDQDAAVAQLERLSANLQQLSSADRQDLAAAWSRLSHEKGYAERSDFIAELAESLGLLEDA